MDYITKSVKHKDRFARQERMTNNIELNGLINNFKKYETLDPNFLLDDTLLEINQKLAEKYADTWFPERYIMSDRNDSIRGSDIEAKEYTLAAYYSMEMVIDLKKIGGIDPRKEIVRIMVETIGKEVSNKVASHKLYCKVYGKEWIMCPYILAIPYRYVDDLTLDPCIGFKTLYGHIMLP